MAPFVITCERLSTYEVQAICTCAGLHTPPRGLPAEALADAEQHTAKTGHQLARGGGIHGAVAS